MKARPPFSSKKLLIAILTICSVLLFLGLAGSVILSGYRYQFDIDEFFYSQLTYLYAHGYRPYLDVYSSVYTPVFQLFIMPVFWIKGFTFEGIYAARVVMIVLLAIRLTFGFFLLKTIFSKRTAILFLPLFLFDPFAVLTTMQIRPDNLMLTLAIIGLLFFTNGLVHRKRKLLAASGFLLGTALLVLTKITPTIIILGVAFTVFCIAKRRFVDLTTFIFGSALPWIIFSLYLLSQGSLFEMYTQMFVEIKLLYNNFTYPLSLNILMRPDNAFVFGVMGKPATWVYLWLLMPLGLTGTYHAVHNILAKKDFGPARLVIMILAVAFVAQWAVLFPLQVVFMQHYMPVHWLAAAFGAYAIDEFLKVSSRYRVAGTIVALLVAASFVTLSVNSIHNNYARATITNQNMMDKIRSLWKQIPPDESVFPGFLFRPAIYPITYGGFIGNVPDPILMRLPDIAQILDVKKPRLLLDDYTLTHLPVNAQLYIQAHYQRVPADGEFMTRNP